MSTTIDDRVVALEFDNKHFERNVSDSLALIEKLENSLAFSESGKGLLDLKGALDSLNLDNISSGVEALQKRFSTFGIIGMRVLENITDKALEIGKGLWDSTIGQITTGGKQRALNLEQANYTLNALLKDGDRVKAVMDDVNASVTGTAYSLDQAAMAASSLASSGIMASAEGGSMQMVLKSIAGVAAMTGAEFNQIADIFTVVAGNGRMMNMEIRRLNQHGMNAAATIKDYWNGVLDGSVEATDAIKAYVREASNGAKVTEADIRDLASHGEISYTIFTNAMYQAYGDAAFKANETYKGAFANLKAALSRIGADFYTPFLTNMTKIFNAIRPIINEIRSALQPAVHYVVNLMNNLTGKALDFFDDFMFFKTFQPFVNGFFNLFKAGVSIVESIGSAFKKVFPHNFARTLDQIGRWFENATKKFLEFVKTSNTLETVFTVLFTVVKIFGKVLGVVFKVLGKVAKVVITVVSAIAQLVLKIRELVVNSKLFQAVTATLQKAVSKIVGFFRNFSEILGEVSKNAGPLLEEFRGRALNAFGVITSGVKAAIPVIKEYFSAFVDGVKSKAPAVLKQFTGSLESALNAVKQYGPGIFSKVIDGFKDFISILSNGLPVLVSTILYNINSILKLIDIYVVPIGNSLFNILIGAIGVIEDRAPELIHALVAALKSILKAAFTEAVTVVISLGSTVFNAIKSFFTGASKEAKTGSDGIKKSIAGVGDIFSGLKDKIASAFSGIIEFFRPLGKLLKNLFENANILDVINTGSFVVTAKAFKDFAGSFKNIGDFFGSAKNALDNIFAPLEKAQNKLNPKIILQIAAAVGILALSIKLLSGVDTTSLGVSIGAISALLWEMYAVTKQLSKIEFDKSGLMKSVVAILAITAAMSIMANALTKVVSSGATWDELATAAAGMVAAIYMLAFAMKEIAKTEFNDKTSLIKMVALSVGIVALAKGVSILLDALSTFSNTDPEAFAMGLFAIIAVLVTFSSAVGEIASAELTGVKGVLIGFAIGLLAIAIAIKILGNLNPDELKQGFITLAVAIAGLVGALYILKDAKIEGVAATILALAVALNLLIAPIILLGVLPWQKVGQGLVMFGMVLLAFTLAIQYMKDPQIKGAAATILALSVAMNLLVLPLIALSQINFLKMIGAIVGMTLALGAMVGAVMVLNAVAKSMSGPRSALGLIALSFSMMLMAAALNMLVIPIVALSALKFTSILKGLGGLILIIAGMAATVAILGVLAPALILGAVALAAFGGAVMLLGLGLKHAIAGLTAFAAIGLSTITTINAMLISLAAAIGVALVELSIALGQAIGELLGNLGDSIHRNKHAIILLIRDLIDIVLVALTDSWPKLVGGFLEAMVGTFDKLIEYTPQLIDKFVDWIITIVDGVEARTPEIVEHIAKLFNTIGNELSKYNAPSMDDIIKSLLGITVVVAILSQIPILGAVKAVGNLAIFIFGLSLILAALGQLSEIQGTKEALERSIEIVGLIGEAIGTFIGSIGVGLTSGLGQIASNLTAFSDNIGSFLDTMSSIGTNTSIMEGVGLIVDAVKEFAKLNGKTIDTGGLAEFTSGLKDMAPGLKDFSDSVKDVNLEAVSTAANAIKILSDTISQLPRSGGNIENWAGSNNADDWAAQLQGLCRGINNFALNVKGKDYSGVEPAMAAVKAVASVSLPNSGGWLGQIVGENDPDLWGKKIPTLGAGIVSFAMKVNGKDFSGVEPAVKAISDIAFAADEIPNEGGAAGFFVGENDVEVWGNKLPALGAGVAEFAENVSGMGSSTSAIESAVNAINLLAAASTSIQESGGNWMNAYNATGVDAFSRNMPVLGEGIKGFSNAIEGVKTAIVKASVEALVALLGGMAQVDGNIPSGDNLPVLGSNLEGFAPGFIEYANAIAGATFSNTNLSITTLSSIVTALAGKEIPTGENLTALGTELASFGPAMATFGNSLVGVEFGSAMSAISTASSASRMLANLQPTSEVAIVSFKAAIAELATTDYQGMVDAFSAGSFDAVGIVTQMLVDMEVAIAGYTGKFRAAAENLMNNFKSGIESKRNAIVTAVSNILSAARTSAGSQSGSFYTAGVNAAQGYINGMNSKIPAVRVAARQIAQTALDTIKNTQDSRSPSRETRKLGSYAGQGFVLGIKDELDSAASMGAELAEMTMFALSHAMDLIDTTGDLTPTISPVLDLTNIQNGIGYMHSMLANDTAYQLAATTGRISSPNSTPLNGLMGRLSNMNNNDVVQELTNLRTDVQTLNANMAKMQIIMDTGALVGSIASPLDAKLGRMAVYKGRGN